MNSGIECLYSLRNEFNVIGLTGRKGAGCSTVAEILEKKDFDLCGFPSEETFVKNNVDRRWNICRSYLQQNWKPFKVIKFYEVICYFLLKDSKQFKENFSSKENNTLVQLIISIIENINSNQNEPEETRKELFNLFFNSDDFKKICVEIKKSSPESFDYYSENIRKWGNPYSCEIDGGEKYQFELAEFINDLIKSVRENNKGAKDKGPAHVVIDSLRNPLEVMFFKERYGAFYLFAVNTTDEIRSERLGIEQLPIENEVKGEELFVKQAPSACLQIADVFLDNDGQNDEKVLETQLIRYLALIQHPGIINPTAEERCMQLAFTAKYNSGCISRQVGAVVTDQNFSVKAMGWNDVPSGHVSCILRSVKNQFGDKDPKSFSEFEKKNHNFKDELIKHYSGKLDNTKLKGRNVSYCFKDVKNCMDCKGNQVHTRAVHAEENAFLQISKYGGEGIIGGILFSTAEPCELCAKKAIQLGIKKIFYVDSYPGITREHIIKSGEENTELIPFKGAVGKAYFKFYQPLLAYKDELAILLELDFSSEKCRNLNENHNSSLSPTGTEG